MADTFPDALKALQEAFARDVPIRIAELRQTWEDPALGDETRLQTLHQLAHRLAGAAGTFGLGSLGEACRAFELKVQATGLEGGVLSGDLRQELGSELQRVEAAACMGAPLAPTPEAVSSGPRRPEVPDLFLLAPAGTSPEWVLHLGSFGFPTRVFSDRDQLAAALAEVRPPLAVVDDDAFPDHGEGSLQTLQVPGEPPVPLILLSDWPDLPSRLQAVRAGARAYLPKPPDLLALVEAVEAHAHRGPAQPYTVLVVEDDPLQAAHHAAVLQGAGMRVEELHDPLGILQPLVDLRPDLVLMDLYMPGCTGVELAAAIRQQEAFVGIPIVFLSQERERNLQLEALRLGGDDFLVKPVDPGHLASIVATRAQRGRVLRSHMVRDSLTGLLNHSAILDRLGAELARAERSGASLAVAMLDLDHFKAVNDTHGHAAGDRVLRALSHMLQQRLRKTDLVGRYGGEEFAVVLPGATAEAAQRILDDIRQSFRELDFVFGGATIRCTFSAGVADFPAHREVERLVPAADEALYAAKREGRDRVKTSS